MKFNIFFLITFLSIALIFLFLNSKRIASHFKLKKVSGDQTPLIGGLGIYLFITFSFFFLYIFKYNFYEDSLTAYFLISFIFLIGIIDDIFEINYNIRLLIIYFILFVFFSFESDYLVNYLYFETFGITYEIEKISIFLTPFFILLLINSLNMADGINGNSSIISIIYLLLIFNINNNLNILFFLFLISILIFLFFNFKNITYLGDSGVYLVSTFIGLYIIKEYNFGVSDLSCERIFLILLIPGIDMFRLFCERILNKKNPFKGDLNHFHHFLKKKFNLSIAVIIYSLMIIWPNLLYKLFNINLIILIILNIIFYFLFIFNIKKVGKIS